MIIRKADAGDVDDIMALAMEYFGESIYAGGTMNEPMMREVVDAAVSGLYPARMLIADTGGEIAGMAYISETRDMVIEGVAEVSMFYVRPEYRNGVAAVALRDEISRVLACESKCRYALVACSSGMGAANDRAFRALFSGSGFCVLGTEMFREIQR